ncbi:hypothetical protein HF670_12120 [Acidithiobacillus thiooxidans]|jgi:hypothetical protein|uniref:Uncharacterized protein n=2 Tax=Acidithiobacillus TaxID=119977 RepID=A0A1C2JFE2_ACITH|nr:MULTISPECIES: hypothetical protein [Acidithiobacillus]MBU2759949.1 hypothetical protein [Acidithiobacillus sulfurivorans]MBU2840291.1 hypothetical protein [Acidithiobacillus thiooxidans]MBU2844127.1 hypothetical protein [Acidithiobacillus thiooxidans]MDA8175746.1 hypothetical protein [Acidithiobacillus sp.]OCX72472.1 hypothetical protein A6P07_09735 [Acidithiobacillus thiooxidans]
MAQAVTSTIKIMGSYADTLRLEAASRRMSLNALATEYALRGMDTLSENDSSNLATFERRIGATILAARSDIEALQAEVDTIAAMMDAFVKLMLVHLPEPGGDEREAVTASALNRYERFLKQVAEAGFSGDRPVAIQKIADLLQQRISVKEVADE